ncbi:hypothetical protein [Providencia sp.]|nr:hypothetical protein [Providencia sp.]
MEMGFEVGSHYTLTRQADELIIQLAEGSKAAKEIPVLGWDLQIFK